MTLSAFRVVNLAYVGSRRAAISEALDLAQYAFLVGIGFAVGVYATALGAGGAFLLTPLLLLRHPGSPPQFVAMASLTVVVTSSGLSSLQALRERRLDYPVLGLLVAAVVPAAVLSAIPRAIASIGFSGAARRCRIISGIQHGNEIPGWPRGPSKSLNSRWVCALTRPGRMATSPRSSASRRALLSRDAITPS